MRDLNKKERGITLIALVMTIVILIILAVVAINAAFGDSGLISQAEKAADYQANAMATDSALINETTDYIEGILSGASQDEEVDLSNKNIVWIGDVYLAAFLNDGKGFQYYFEEMETVNSSIDITGEITISDNTPENKTIKFILDELIRTKDDYPNIDIFILNLGVFDSYAYKFDVLDQNLKKEIGNVNTEIDTVTEGDSVINDLEDFLYLFKQEFPDTKLLFFNPFNHSENAIRNFVWKNIVKPLDSDLEFYQSYFGKNYETIDEFRDLYFADTSNPEAVYTYSIVTNVKTRADNLYTEIPKALEKFGYEYLDLSGYIEQAGTEYYYSDLFNLSDLGYKSLTPYIVEKVKEMLPVENEENEEVEIDLSGKTFVWLGDSLMTGANETSGDPFSTHFQQITGATCYNLSVRRSSD